MTLLLVVFPCLLTISVEALQVGLRRGNCASSSLKGEVMCVLRRRCCRQAALAP